jgi:hypothetical protein
MEFQFLATFTSRTAQFAGCCPVILLPNSISNLQAALLLVSAHPHALVLLLVPLSMLRSLGEALHIYTLCRLFTIFFQTVSHGDAIIPLFLVVSYCPFSHSGRGYQQLLQTFKNRAASTVQHMAMSCG